MARSKKIQTREPQVTTRDPERYKPRHYIPASMPTICPDCGHSTRMANGRHVDPVHKHILEYRTCVKCGKRLTCGRMMTNREQEQFCDYAEGVAEYQNTVKKGE